jgi:hypothetical protein
MTRGWQTPRCSSTGTCESQWPLGPAVVAWPPSLEAKVHAAAWRAGEPHTCVVAYAVAQLLCCCWATRDAWHRPAVDEFVDNMRRLRWGEIGYGSLRTWGMLGSRYW